MRTDTFAPGTRFTEITALYEFDRKLRTQVHDGIERVEIALRTSLADIISSTGSLALYDRDNFRVTRGREYEHYQIISTITSRVRLIHKGFRRLTLAADPLAWFASLTRRFTPAAEPAASL
ncbi:hypothetical protein A7979_10490 [Rothia nasimurium]|uniref:Uncharacterized protein n=1 Tax=Rothia nasimurium TaxID=85336 RepID=A0A1Y1RSM8_9MICC|nr:hypothetical protein A7979_10490 [Rothia nasimurium]